MKIIGDQVRISEAELIHYMNHMAGLIFDAIYQVRKKNATLKLVELMILNKICASSITNQPISVSELATEMGKPVASTSKYVANFICDGLVIDKIDPSDRRRHLLFFTEEAMKQTRKWVDLMNRHRTKAHEDGMPVTKMYDVDEPRHPAHPDADITM